MKLKKVRFMFKALKMKIAARRIEKKANARKNMKNRKNKNAKTFWARTWDIICTPFRAIGRVCKKIWAWIRSLDLIGLVNSTLLCAIIVLFSMLIIDIVKCNKTPVVIVAQNDIETNIKPQISVSEQPAPRSVRTRTVSATLPLRTDTKTREFIDAPVNVAHVKPDMVAIQQTARCGKVMYGDVIIDSRGAATMLKSGDIVRGNLFLQNMRKYTLPRGVRIEGNLFLRDMGLLQFAGEFTVTGNIYVTPTSSFGPIPGTARIGGQVII